MSGRQVTASLGAIPAHLANAANKLSLNAAAHANLRASFAVVTIRGKEFRVRYRGDETLAAENAGAGIEVIVVGMASAISKKFYLEGYSDGERKMPDCFSINGISPDPASPDKQNAYCATCPQNVWGSATTEKGRKAKACRDGRRLAVVPAGDVANDVFGGPMLLDVPPTSLNNLARYVRALEGMQADISQLQTKIMFNRDVTHQELLFVPVGWVGPEDYPVVVEQGQSDLVRQMLDVEVDDVTADAPGLAGLGAKPAHLDMPAAAPVKPAAAAPQAAPQRTSPFAAARAQATPAAAPAASTAPAAAKAKAQVPLNPAPTIVHGAPAEIEAQIDALMNNDC